MIPGTSHSITWHWDLIDTHSRVPMDTHTYPTCTHPHTTDYILYILVCNLLMESAWMIHKLCLSHANFISDSQKHFIFIVRSSAHTHTHTQRLTEVDFRAVCIFLSTLVAQAEEHNVFFCNPNQFSYCGVNKRSESCYTSKRYFPSSPNTNIASSSMNLFKLTTIASKPILTFIMF